MSKTNSKKQSAPASTRPADRLTQLIATLREAEQDRYLVRLRQKLAKLDLLVLDELGYVPASKAGGIAIRHRL